MGQLDFTGSGDELQRQKKGPWSLGERKPEVMHLGKGVGKRWRDRDRNRDKGRERKVGPKLTI